MRINLNCPYSDKDRAKALGARWDAEKRVWYIVNMEDLTPFMRWIAGGSTATRSEKPLKSVERKQHRKPAKDRHAAAITGGKLVQFCGCDALPWEDCEHTDALAMAAMNSILNETKEAA